MKKHIMKLNPDSFNKIKNGSKIIEVRLNDEKRREINIGDTIIFLKEPEKVESIETMAVGLLRFNTFKDLLNDYSPTCFGSENKEELLNNIYNYYSKEKEAQYGVLGIRVKIQ